MQKKIESLLQQANVETLQKISALGPVQNPIEGIDYELNDLGHWVFSKWYHLRRGQCCNSGCVNCPYP